jgi:hypothetical protein
MYQAGVVRSDISINTDIRALVKTALENEKVSR